MSKIPKDSLLYAGKLLDRLRELDAIVHGAYYEMGQILSAIEHGKLYDALGYGSMAELIGEELSYSTSQGYRYLHTYRHFKRLGYTKTEALELIGQHSFSLMSKYLPTASGKVSKRAVKAGVERVRREQRQINFQLHEKDLDVLTRALEAYGALPRDGRLMNSSAALVAMAKSALGLELGDDEKPRLRAVK